MIMSKNTALIGNFSIHENCFKKMLIVFLSLSVIYLLSSCTTQHMKKEHLQQFNQQLSSSQKVAVVSNMAPDLTSSAVRNDLSVQVLVRTTIPLWKESVLVPEFNVNQYVNAAVVEWLDSHDITDVTVLENILDVSGDKLSVFLEQKRLEGFDAVILISDYDASDPNKGFGVKFMFSTLLLVDPIPVKVNSSVYMSCKMAFMSTNPGGKHFYWNFAVNEPVRFDVPIRAFYGTTAPYGKMDPANKKKVRESLTSIIQSNFSAYLQTLGLEGF